jgi:hypothetical protein
MCDRQSCSIRVRLVYGRFLSLESDASAKAVLDKRLLQPKADGQTESTEVFIKEDMTGDYKSQQLHA